MHQSLDLRCAKAEPAALSVLQAKGSGGGAAPHGSLPGHEKKEGLSLAGT